MTRLQAISKTVLTVLGIYAVVVLGHSYPGRYFSPAIQPPFRIVLEILFFLAFMTLVAFAAYVMIFRNEALARAIVGEEDIAEPIDASLLAKSLRIGVVLAGLMLLPGSARFLVELLRLPFVLRPVINEWIVSGITSYLARFTWPQWYMMGFRLFRATLAVYLIAGAPHLVRLQVRQCFDLGLDSSQASSHSEGYNDE
jgi:hypothetical protein